MTLQWTVVAIVLYCEIFVLLLLILPWIRPQIWQKIFKSRILRSLEAYSAVYWYAFAGILLLLFFDAIREVRKYSGADKEESLGHTAQGEALLHMRLFRAQRNLYISGFALFLVMIIKRITYLIGQEAHLMASAEAAMRQAQGASDAAKRMLDTTKKEGGVDTEETKQLKETVDNLRKEMRKLEHDRNAMKEQAEGIKREYDRLLNESSRDSGNKKDE